MNTKQSGSAMLPVWLVSAIPIPVKGVPPPNAVAGSESANGVVLKSIPGRAALTPLSIKNRPD